MKKEICEYHFYVRTKEGPYGWQLSSMSSLIYGTVPGRAKLPPLLVNSVQVKITSSSQNLSANPSPCDHLLFCLLCDPLPCLDSSFGKLPFALFSLSCLLNGTKCLSISFLSITHNFQTTVQTCRSFTAQKSVPI